MALTKICFGVDGTALALNESGTLQERDPGYHPSPPWFINDLKDALELGAVNNKTIISIPGFPEATLLDIRVAWKF